jgi:hypothetical protein
MRIGDPGSGMEKSWIRDQGSRMEKILIQNLGSGMVKDSDSGSGIWDKHPGSAKLEILSPNLLGFKEPSNNKPLLQLTFKRP